MVTYTDEYIAHLISCPKKITEAPKKEDSLISGSYRNMVQLKSKEDLEFSMFIRRLNALDELFSIGLIYHPNEGSGQIVVLRCNGPHGDHTNYPAGDEHFTNHHIHRATQKAIETGLKPERFAEVAQEFATYDEALAYFVKTANITDADKYFSIRRQPTLFT